MGTILRSLGELGYGWAYRVLDAQWFGVPQRRRRVFIVGCLGGWRSATEVLFERESLPWDSPPSRETGTRVADPIARSFAKHGGRSAGKDSQPRNIITHTLKAEGYDGSEDGTGRGTPLISVAENQRGELRQSHVSPQLSCPGGKPGSGYAAVQVGMAVRRLTPLECCRLQGFPDDWLDVERLSDSAKYRMLGNAVAIPVAQWIAERVLNER